MIDIQLDAPIIAGKGLAGLRLDMSVAEFGALVESSRSDGDLQVEALGENGGAGVRYYFGGGAASISMDVDQEKLIQMIARPGYRGSLLGKIRIGMTIREAMEVEPRLYIEERDNGFRLRLNSLTEAIKRRTGPPGRGNPDDLK